MVRAFINGKEVRKEDLGKYEVAMTTARKVIGLREKKSNGNKYKQLGG